MEREYLFNVYIDGRLIKLVSAHTKWEAIDKVYSRLICEYPDLNRSSIKAERI
jgi:hypothetical protein